jgi:hypothetical protein
MSIESKTIASRGKTVRVPTAQVGGRTVIVSGRFLRVASIYDEAFAESDVPEPLDFLNILGKSGLKADIFTFSEKIHTLEPEHPYSFEWDNAAVANTASYTDWWESLPQVVRKNVRRAAKRGVTVDVAVFDDEFVRGIKSLYDETPLRQGRKFWHFGKDLETVRSENSSYLNRSDFIGAYCDGELIGFVKLVYAGKTAVVMQILAKAAHYDKRPMNALIAKAVETCHEKGMSYLVYSKFTYGKKTQSDIQEFKRRNGFVQVNFRKYFVPLTIKGRVAFALKLHRSVLELLPSGVINMLLSLRSKLLDWVSTGHSTSGPIHAQNSTSPAEGE